jgi:hypothetical protein
VYLHSLPRAISLFDLILTSPPSPLRITFPTKVAALLAKFDEDEGEARAGTYQLDPPGHKRSIGGRLEEATLCEKIAREYARNEDEGKAKR